MQLEYCVNLDLFFARLETISLQDMHTIIFNIFFQQNKGIIDLDYFMVRLLRVNSNLQSCTSFVKGFGATNPISLSKPINSYKLTSENQVVRVIQNAYKFGGLEIMKYLRGKNRKAVGQAS